MRTDHARPVRLQDYRPSDWLIDSVDLDISLHASATRVRARLSVRPNPAAAGPAPLRLDGDELSLSSIAIDGVALPDDAYAATPDSLTIAQPPRGAFRLDIETTIDPSANTQLMGLYRSSGTYCTQCEAEGFRRITYFLDRPDVMAVYTTRIEASRTDVPVLLANGNLVESGSLPNDRHFAVWHDPHPKPSYLFALVGGNLGCVDDTFTTASGQNVALKIYVEHGKEDRCAYAMDSLKRSMRWDEQVFGREYDLDIFMIVAVSDFNMGAMENKGLNVFNDKYVLASSDTATDGDFASIEAIIAHEYFHNWTGNRITCRDWFQLCLKEGLTVFRDQEFTSDQRSRPVKRISDVRLLRAHQFVEDAGPLAHPVRPELYHEINNFYTATVYEKGAEVVRMIKTLLGPDLFRKGMDLYFERHDGEAATIEQFVQCFADASGKNFAQFMRWYSQAGTPEVTANGQYDPVTRHYRLDLAQTLAATPGQKTKEPMVIPLALGLVARDGRDVALHPNAGARLERGVAILSSPATTIEFSDIPEQPVLSINRGFSAPVRLVTNLTAADLQHLAAHDSDPFNRWQALQTFALRILIMNVASLREAKNTNSDNGLMDALAAILGDKSLEPAFVAQALTPPSEADIAREIGRDVDPDAIFAARTHLRRKMAERLGGALLTIYQQYSIRETYSPDSVSAGRRSLKNICLDLLAANGQAGDIERAFAQYQSADNMTDRLAGLSTLSLHDKPQRTAAFEDFYARYASDPLIVDKWLTLQAAIPERITLDRVVALTAHQAFAVTNPNRVRALIGTFAQGNPTQFNRADGAGYEFVADYVLKLNGTNPQVASRLMTAFKSWRALEPGRRTLAEAAIRRVAGAGNLSADVKDIAGRALSGE
jgi:aminopeptidase N